VTSDTIRVRLSGGTLIVRPRGERYELAGPAEYVFTGES
jgi:diaminopimelate epimerase